MPLLVPEENIYVLMIHSSGRVTMCNSYRRETIGENKFCNALVVIRTLNFFATTLRP